MQEFAFPVLKLVDWCGRIGSRRDTVRVRFEHPLRPRAMLEAYTSPKSPEGLLRIQASPAEGQWREFIRLGSRYFENHYALTAVGDVWRCTPSFRTWTARLTLEFRIDLSDPRRTLLELYSTPELVRSAHFSDWFDYVRSVGVEEISVEHHPGRCFTLGEAAS
jgi:hypothetical protein